MTAHWNCESVTNGSFEGFLCWKGHASLNCLVPYNSLPSQLKLSFAVLAFPPWTLYIYWHPYTCTIFPSVALFFQYFSLPLSTGSSPNIQESCPTTVLLNICDMFFIALFTFPKLYGLASNGIKTTVTTISTFPR